MSSRKCLGTEAVGLHQGQRHKPRKKAGHMAEADQAVRNVKSLANRGRPHMAPPKITCSSAKMPRVSLHTAPIRMRSWKWMIPTTAPRSTTRSAEILWLMLSSASSTSASGAIVRGLRVITSMTGVSSEKSGFRWRRRSPSVTIPTSLSSSNAATQPKPFDDISTIASAMRALASMRGRARPCA